MHAPVLRTLLVVAPTLLTLQIVGLHYRRSERSGSAQMVLLPPTPACVNMNGGRVDDACFSKSCARQNA
eukprot:3513712-Pleurochrysis_carterae.AAC.1